MSSSFDNKVYDIIAEGSGGGSFTAGNGIDITSGTISVKVDNATIKTNSSGQLYSPTAKSIVQDDDEYIKLFLTSISDQFVIMYIRATLDANVMRSVDFNEEVTGILENTYPINVQSLGFNHTINGVSENDYTFTSTEGDGGSIDFSNINRVSITIGANDNTHYHNFVAYYFVK